MSRARTRRLATVLFAVVSLLLSQLALARYVCPPQVVDGVAAVMRAGQPCAGMDAEQPSLCHQHAADPGQSLEAVKLPAAPLPVGVLMFERPAGVEVAPLPPALRRTATEGRPPPDPLFLATLRLRI